MAELIQQILSLSKAEQLQIMSIMIKHMQADAETIPDWQISLAQSALSEIEKNEDLLVSNADFWSQIDAKVEALEQHTTE